MAIAFNGNSGKKRQNPTEFTKLGTRHESLNRYICLRRHTVVSYLIPFKTDSIDSTGCSKIINVTEMNTGIT